MNRSNTLALGLALLMAGAVASTHREPTQPTRPGNARPALITRPRVVVRQTPSPQAPALGMLSRGDHVLVDPTETSFPGFIPLVRESIDASGVRFEGILGWIQTADVTFATTLETSASRFSASPALVATVGLIAGRHTLAETRDLLAVADYRFREVREAMEESRARPLAPATRADLEADWARLSASWEQARREVARNLTLKGVAYPVIFTADMIPTEDEWVRVLSFVQGQELVKGSLQDITRRLERALGRQILFKDQPAQTTVDIDLDLFRALDTEIKAGEEAAKRAAETAKSAALSPTGLAIGGTLLTLGGVALAITLLPEILAARTALRAARRR